MRARRTARAVETVGYHRSGAPPGRSEPEIFIGARRGDTAARRAIEKAGLDQERLVDVFDRVLFFADGGRDAVDAHRAAAELVDDGSQQLAIDLVEAVIVDLEQLQRRARDLGVDPAVGADLRIVAHAPQEAVRDARRAARPARQFVRGFGVDRHVENPRRTADDLLDVAVVVEVEPMDDAEPRAQRRREQAGARRRANQRELLQRHLHRPRARSLADHDVEFVVLHRRIQDFFDGRRQTMDLVDEENLVLLEIREHRGQIARLLDDRPGCRAHRHAQLVANDVGERRLAEARRSVEQDVIERFLAPARGGNRHMQVVAHAILADVLVQRSRAESRLVLRVVVDAPGGDQTIVHRISSRSALFSASSNVAPPSRAQRRISRFLGQRPMIAQVLQRRDQVVAQTIRAAAAVPRRPRRPARASREAILQLEHDALRGLLADPGNRW